jgi:UDP-N-acetylmuramyl pentapeptide phosphotransferase/UDP-N-acetylglucosamine-1-phosphate transferase
MILPLMLFGAVVLAFLSAGLLTPLLTAWAHRNDFLDIPNSRSSHVVATPRIGGVAIIASVLVGLAVLEAFGPGLGREATVVVAAALAIAALGLVDDFWPLSAVPRLLFQAAVGAWVVLAIDPTALQELTASGSVASCLTVLWIVAVTNSYNFMDGIDGIAGAEALVAGFGWTAAALLTGSPEIAALGGILAGSSAGFLLHNWQPAKVFMGDAGSGFLGFVFASIPLLAPRNHASLFWCAALLMWPFLFDTGFTLLRRASRSENLLSAHRSHIYQRLVLTGRSHSYVTRVYAGLAILGAVAAASVAGGSISLTVISAVLIVVSAGALWWNVTSREAVGRDRAVRRTAL